MDRMNASKHWPSQQLSSCGWESQSVNQNTSCSNMSTRAAVASEEPGRWQSFIFQHWCTNNNWGSTRDSFVFHPRCTTCTNDSTKANWIVTNLKSSVYSHQWNTHLNPLADLQVRAAWIDLESFVKLTVLTANYYWVIHSLSLCTSPKLTQCS